MNLPFEQQPVYQPNIWSKQIMQQQMDVVFSDESDGHDQSGSKLHVSDEDVVDLLAELAERNPAAISPELAEAVRNEIAKRNKSTE